MTVIQVLIGGLLTGCIYALVAVGLALIWGLMGLVNFAHGDFLMFGMYLTFWAWALFNIDPVYMIPLTGISLFFIGIFVYYGMTKKILKAGRPTQIFATFGLGILIRSTAQFVWTPNYRMISNPLLGGVIQIGRINFGRAHLVAGLGAFIIAMSFYLLIFKTNLGRALRATSEDKEVAELMGINTDHMFALGWALGTTCVGIAGALLASYYYIYPNVGIVFGTLAPAIVALGGFGSLPGAFVAALIVGITQTSVSFFLSPAWKIAVIYVMYIAIVVLKPKGLFGRW